MPRPPAEVKSSERLPCQQIDRDDLLRAGVRDERVTAVRVSGRVARLDEIVQDVPHAKRAPVDDRECTDIRVADECVAVADPLDAAWVGQDGDRSHDATCCNIHDGHAGLGIARDDRERRGQGERRPRPHRERRGCCKREELATVHAPGFGQSGRERKEESSRAFHSRLRTPRSNPSAQSAARCERCASPRDRQSPANARSGIAGGRRITSFPRTVHRLAPSVEKPSVVRGPAWPRRLPVITTRREYEGAMAIRARCR